MARQPNIEAAIRRSRNARARRQSRRRRSLVLAALVSVALGGGGVLSLNALTGAGVVHAAVAQAQSLADLLNQRSPGERTAAQLTKTKRARALGKTRARPHVGLTAGPPAELANILMPPPAEVALELAPPLPMASLIAPPPLAGLVAPPPGAGGPIVSPPGGGGGGGVSPPGGGGQILPPNETHVPVPSAVPEPATWALMLLGFGLIGWRARRAKAARPARQDSLAALLRN